MRITFDRKANAAYVYLVDDIKPGEVAVTAEMPSDSASINVDFDADGRVLGIEVLGARRVLRAETLAAASDITKRS